MVDNKKEIIGIKIGSFTTSIGKSTIKNNLITFDLSLLDNNTYRQIPTLYTFESTTNQYIGMIALAHLKKSINYTIENISRLISIEIKTDFAKKEMEYIKYAKWDPKREKFIVQAQDGIATRLPSEIVPSYIGILRNIYLPDLGKNEEVYINIPDYLTYIQKKKYIDLLKESNINGYLIPESVAYTIYYGYTKSGDLFVHTPIRYVLLVDIGHSKTTYILAKYEKEKYQIMDFEIHQFGGRDIDHLLYKYFSNYDTIDEKTIKKDKLLKFRFKLYEQIKEIKQMIAVNNEYEIGIDKLDGDEKINVEITRGTFEEVTKDILDKINFTFNLFLEKCYNSVGSNLIIEILSDLLKLPYLKHNMEKNKYKIKVSQTVQHDESVAIGCCLYGSFKNNMFPQKNFKEILGYNSTNIYYSINSNGQMEFLQKGEAIPIDKRITVNLKKDLKDGKMKIKLFYLHNDIKFYSNDCSILEFVFTPNEEIINNAEEVDIHLSVEINGLIECKNVSYSYTKNFPINTKKKKSMITFIEKNETTINKQLEKIDDNPFERDERTEYIISKTKNLLDGGNEEQTNQSKGNTKTPQGQLKENTPHGTDPIQNQTMEKVNAEKKELRELLNTFNAQIIAKNLTERKINNLNHAQFLEKFMNKIKSSSTEKELFNLKIDLFNRTANLNQNIKEDINKISHIIKDSIKKYNKIISENTSNQRKYSSEKIANIIQKKEKLEELEKKLNFCIDEDDLTQIKKEYNQIFK